MPKLSAYVATPSAAPSGGQAQLQPGAAAAAAPLAAATSAAPQQQQQQPLLPTQAGQPDLDAEHQAAAAKLKADYSKRLREHGPRVFRWPDGSLRPDRPPPNPHAVANRRQWAPLVEHCRTHGGELSFERTGASLRHGLRVPHSQHAAYLAAIGLEPETDAAGAFVGEAAGLPGPLEDPMHAFHTYYKEGAAAVFKHKLGRLL